MKIATLALTIAALLGCATNPKPAALPAHRQLSFIQLYLFNRSGNTADLRVALDDSVLYYAQVQSTTIPSAISGGRLVQRVPGSYRVVLNDYTHGQQITRDVSLNERVVYVVVTTKERGSELDVSTKRPF